MRWFKSDCDRLDEAFAAMERANLIAIQHAGGTNSMGLDRIEDEQNWRVYNGRPARGYCFYHEQNIDDAIEGKPLWLAWGRHESVASLILEILRTVGLKATWSGAGREKISVRVKWNRKQPLEMWVPKGRPYPFYTPQQERANELRRAVLFGELEKARALLGEGLDPNGDDEDSLLHVAMRHGSNPPMVSLLLHAGANRNRPTYGELPIETARRKGFQEIVALLTN